MEKNTSNADAIFERIKQKIQERKNPKGCMSIDSDKVYFGEDELKEVLEEFAL